MSFKWQTFNKNSKRFEFLLAMSFYWHKGSFSWSAFILMTSLCVHGHCYWRCADKWSFIMTVYTRLYAPMLQCYAYCLLVHTCSQWRYIMVLHICIDLNLRTINKVKIGVHFEEKKIHPKTFHEGRLYDLRRSRQKSHPHQYLRSDP